MRLAPHLPLTRSPDPRIGFEAGASRLGLLVT
jgi:hypothetical protein